MHGDHHYANVLWCRENYTTFALERIEQMITAL